MSLINVNEVCIGRGELPFGASTSSEDWDRFKHLADYGYELKDSWQGRDMRSDDKLTYESETNAYRRNVRKLYENFFDEIINFVRNI